MHCHKYQHVPSLLELILWLKLLSAGHDDLQLRKLPAKIPHRWALPFQASVQSGRTFAKLAAIVPESHNGGTMSSTSWHLLFSQVGGAVAGPRLPATTRRAVRAALRGRPRRTTLQGESLRPLGVHLCSTDEGHLCPRRGSALAMQRASACSRQQQKRRPKIQFHTRAEIRDLRGLLSQSIPPDCRTSRGSPPRPEQVARDLGVESSTGHSSLHRTSAVGRAPCPQLQRAACSIGSGSPCSEHFTRSSCG